MFSSSLHFKRINSFTKHFQIVDGSISLIANAFILSLIHISPEQYKSLYRDLERQRYLKNLDDYYYSISLNELKNDKSMLIKANVDIFKIVETGMLLE